MIKREYENFLSKGVSELGICRGALYFVDEKGERCSDVRNIKELRLEIYRYTKNVRKNLSILDSISIDFQNSLVVCDFIKRETFNEFCKEHSKFYNNYNLFIIQKEFKKNILNSSIKY